MHLNLCVCACGLHVYVSEHVRIIVSRMDYYYPQGQYVLSMAACVLPLLGRPWELSVHVLVRLCLRMCMRLHIWMRLSENVLMIFTVLLVRVHVRSFAAFMLAHACACACMHAFHVHVYVRACTCTNSGFISGSWMVHS